MSSLSKYQNQKVLGRESFGFCCDTNTDAENTIQNNMLIQPPQGMRGEGGCGIAQHIS